jgi:hypothetical protein
MEIFNSDTSSSSLSRSRDSTERECKKCCGRRVARAVEYFVLRYEVPVQLANWARVETSLRSASTQQTQIV